MMALKYDKLNFFGLLLLKNVQYSVSNKGTFTANTQITQISERSL